MLIQVDMDALQVTVEDWKDTKLILMSEVNIYFETNS